MCNGSGGGGHAGNMHLARRRSVDPPFPWTVAEKLSFRRRFLCRSASLELAAWAGQAWHQCKRIDSADRPVSLYSTRNQALALAECTCTVCSIRTTVERNIPNASRAGHVSTRGGLRARCSPGFVFSVPFLVCGGVATGEAAATAATVIRPADANMPCPSSRPARPRTAPHAARRGRVRAQLTGPR